MITDDPADRSPDPVHDPDHEHDLTSGPERLDASRRIREESARSAAVLAALDPVTAVPTCPGWTATDLLWHLTEVHEFWAGLLATGALTDADAQAVDEGKDPRPEGEDARERLLARRERATAALLDQLAAHADPERAWTWFGADQSVGFTRRMQVHEATLHRLDAELAAGVSPLSPVDPEVATDGLDHAVSVMWAAGHEWVPDWAEVETLAVLRLVPVDPDVLGDSESGAPGPRDVEIARWSGTSPRDGAAHSHLLARPLPADGEVTGLPMARATGSTLALDLWVWGRELALDHLSDGPGTVALDGDERAVAAVRELIAQGMD